MGLRLTIGKPGGMGLGSMIRSITSAIGVKACGGCKEREKILNAASDRLRFGGKGTPPAK